MAEEYAHDIVLNGHDGTGGGTEADSLYLYDNANGNTLNGDGGEDSFEIGNLYSSDSGCTTNILNGGDGDDEAWADGDTSGNTFYGDAGTDTMTDLGSNTFVQ